MQKILLLNMGCCEVRTDIISNPNEEINSKIDDSFNDLSIYSNHCETVMSQIQNTELPSQRGRSLSNSHSMTLEYAFITISSQNLKPFDSHPTIGQT
jgi:hypothetical protein